MPARRDLGIGQPAHAVLEQRRALADAEQFVAQHAVGRVGLLQALRLRALVAAQRIDACVQRLPLLRHRICACVVVLLARLPPQPAAPAQHRQGNEDDQHDDAAAAR